MSGNKHKKNIAERLFFTFGTVFLAAIIAVCAINYKKDGRAANTAFMQAATGTGASAGAAETTRDK